MSDQIDQSFENFAELANIKYNNCNFNKDKHCYTSNENNSSCLKLDECAKACAQWRDSANDRSNYTLNCLRYNGGTQ